MSSIAYATDYRMLEYHRLCRNHEMIFWRLATKKRFSDFHPGDLLFFYARSNMSKKKGLIGYAHFDSIRRLSVRQMWDTYRDMTGYDSYEKLYETIVRASKGDVPKKMNCLYLKDVVFFMTPICPKEVGLDIPSNLESYCYIDKDDPGITLRILKKAEELGIDVWSWDSIDQPETIFRQDAVRHLSAMICHETDAGQSSGRKTAEAQRLARTQLKEPGWEYSVGSKTVCFMAHGNTIYIALPYVYGQKDRTKSAQELYGKIVMMQEMIRDEDPSLRYEFRIMGDFVPADVREMVIRLNERL